MDPPQRRRSSTHSSSTHPSTHSSTHGDTPERRRSSIEEHVDNLNAENDRPCLSVALLSQLNDELSVEVQLARRHSNKSVASDDSVYNKENTVITRRFSTSVSWIKGCFNDSKRQIDAWEGKNLYICYEEKRTEYESVLRTRRLLRQANRQQEGGYSPSGLRKRRKLARRLQTRLRGLVAAVHRFSDIARQRFSSINTKRRIAAITDCEEEAQTEPKQCVAAATNN